jgi:hypothetical protein
LIPSNHYAAGMDLPILCTLTETELQERRQTILKVVGEAALESHAIAGGYCYRFKPQPEMLTQVARLIDLERQCCRFLTFKLVAEAGDQPLTLEITGPPEAAAFLADLFGG